MRFIPWSKRHIAIVPTCISSRILKYLNFHQKIRTVKIGRGPLWRKLTNESLANGKNWSWPKIHTIRASTCLSSRKLKLVNFYHKIQQAEASICVFFSSNIIYLIHAVTFNLSNYAMKIFGCVQITLNASDRVMSRCAIIESKQNQNKTKLKQNKS